MGGASYASGHPVPTPDPTAVEWWSRLGILWEGRGEGKGGGEVRLVSIVTGQPDPDDPVEGRGSGALVWERKK